MKGDLQVIHMKVKIFLAHIYTLTEKGKVSTLDRQNFRICIHERQDFDQNMPIIQKMSSQSKDHKRRWLSMYNRSRH